ncbi:hypothetical protein LSH36_269g09031 [Paralvinella palmiformis]|uniref:Uncharacterized protein n=1 Tax=Paralvinella palmiformis TaxID=53620 RepID=A0AAD9JJN4_9ANNE|nr:hypothetical protein LSH36_269g09031 [Paralvinella palmiformis]
MGRKKKFVGVVGFPLLTHVMTTLSVIAHSNADSERVFSMVRKIDTDSRSQLGSDTLRALLSCKINTDDPCYAFVSDKDLCKCKKALAPRLDANVVQLGRNHKFSLLTDSGGEKTLAILVKVFNPEIARAVTRFVDIPMCNIGTGANIFETIDNCFSNLDNHYQSFNSDIILWGLPLNRDRLGLGGKGIFDFLHNYKNPCWLDNGTNQIRCLPYFYQLGVGKCGTTTLYTQLVKHPDIVSPKYKELFFWSSVIRRNQFDDYVDTFADVTNVIRESGDLYGFHRKITLDATPAYFTNFGYITSIPGNMKDGEPIYTLPHTLYAINLLTKFIVILRNPVDRLYSHYYHFHRDTASAREFHYLAVNGTRMMSECLRVRTIRSCVFDYKLNADISQKRHLDQYTQDHKLPIGYTSRPISPDFDPSTDTSFGILLTDYIKQERYKGNFVGMVLLDLQKAFDAVDHDIFMEKLKALGLGHSALK